MSRLLAAHGPLARPGGPGRVRSGGQSTTLIEAVKRGDHAAVRTLARNRAEVNRAEPDGTTPLHYAVQANDIELIALLLKAGANAKAANRYGVQPLTLAATNGSAAAIDALLAAGADANAAGPGGEPVLMTAARSGSVDAVRRLLTRGANANVAEPWFGETALMWAASENHGGGGAPAGRIGRGGQRAFEGARRAGAGVPAQRRPQFAAAARRLDGADVRGARRIDRCGARPGRDRAPTSTSPRCRRPTCR